MPGEEAKSIKQERAEADVGGFQDGLGPFVVAAETTRMAMVFTNAKEAGNPIIFANDSYLSLTGYAREEVMGQRFNFLLAQAADPQVLTQVKAAFASGAAGFDVEYRRKDASTFWASTFISPVRDKVGAIVEHFVSLADLSRHKREEDRLRFLLDELNHRTQNTLATVQAIAAQTLRAAIDKDVYDLFEGRILALSKAHGLLGRENWQALSLRDVLDQILEPFGLGDRRVTRFVLQGEDMTLPPKAALTLAMVFHELATNAVKHGAFSNGGGQIDISWQVEPSPQGRSMRLQWRESGGPPVTAPLHKGFGSRLIQTGLAQAIDGQVRLDYARTGLTCEIVMPLPQAPTHG
ncbi:HWE histidine kinase domain-containing protein [Phenylobacterium sp.]|uniref:HWE histidine kinase domain-containing protein n=1 Tax=Phenylobacterium sp. TaxID=1871053 RepID=UPI002718B00A|nr:HWE histidine kinase domain-containing protein [Phenylobacterium sp.]MDO8379512.1 HWE histidine kinase domain-containing protein [Phenylobacterium sp.]